MKQITFLTVLIAAFSLLSCASNDTTPSGQNQATSFGRLQEKVLTPSCAISGCHVAGAQFAEESGLILSADVAYENLVGVAAKQAHAKEHGLFRVKPGDPDSSFLYMKLQTHLDPEYGSKMPLGKSRISVGQLEFIRRWIADGASKTTDHIDPVLLEDTTLPPLEAFTPLELPAAGTGYQLTIDPFEVKQHFERELFVYREVGNTEPIYVNRVQTKMRSGSHHFVFYTFDSSVPKAVVPIHDVVRDIRNTNGTLNYANMAPMEYHIYAGGTQMGGDIDYRFPPGAALVLPSNASLDLNAHYVNRSFASLTGECYVNLYTMPASEVQYPVYPLNLNNMDISIPPQTRKTITKTFLNTTGKPMNIIMMTSHTHEWMERFTIKIKGGQRNGEIVYETSDWAHPGVTYYDPPIVIKPGEGVTSEVIYNNTTNRTIEFGLESTDEMDIIFGYYY